MRRYDRRYAEMKRMLDSDKLGTPLMFYAAHRNISQVAGFATDYAITCVAIHELDISRWLLGDEYETVQALSVRQSGETARDWLNPQVIVLTAKSDQRIDIEVQTNGAYVYDVQRQVVAERRVNLPDPATSVTRTGAQCGFPILTDWSQRVIDACDTEYSA